MYAPPGYEFYQIIAISAMCAVGMLTIASLIGAGVSYLVLREPSHRRQPAETTGMVPAGTAPTRAAFEPTPTVVMG